MKRYLKVTVSVFVLLCMLVVGLENHSMNVTATASTVKTCLDNYNSGVAALLDPTNCITKEEIKLVETQEEIDFITELLTYLDSQLPPPEQNIIDFQNDCH